MPKQAAKKQPPKTWRRHFFYRRESLRTTWKLRFLVLFLFGSTAILTRSIWTERLANSLRCDEDIAPADALLVENFDQDYILFEHAAELHRRGVAGRVLTLTRAGDSPEIPDPVSRQVADLMAGVARIKTVEFIPVPNTEPITMNAAYQVRDFLTSRNLRSLVLVTQDLRSRRSLLVYEKVMGPAGIRMGCAPVHGEKSKTNWAQTNHGLFEVFEQYVKLAYYRFYVLLLAQTTGW